MPCNHVEAARSWRVIQTGWAASATAVAAGQEWLMKLKRVLYLLLVASAFSGAVGATQPPNIVCVMDGCGPSLLSQPR
jgi:hypothetical protein